MSFLHRHPGPAVALLALVLSVATALLSLWSRAEAAPLRERVVVLETIIPEIRADVKETKEYAKETRDEVKELRRLQAKDTDARR